MRTELIVIVIFFIISLVSCKQTEFCGNVPTPAQMEAYYSLSPRTPGMQPVIKGKPKPEILFQIAMDMYNDNKMPEEANTPMAFTYSKNDTTILRIWDLKKGDLKMAKRISCIVFSNSYINEFALAFLEIEIDGTEYLFVNHGE